MPAIEAYALIGDLHTAALISREGSIDWLCLPDFDDPACFAALLGDESAGSWQLRPVTGGHVVSRSYEDDTLVLRTRWEAPDGVVDVVDFMPPRDRAVDLVRIVEGVRGQVSMRTAVRLRFDYGRVRPWIRAGEHRVGERRPGTPEERPAHGVTETTRMVSAVAGPDSAWLNSDVPVHHTGDHLEAEFRVEPGDRVAFVLTHQRSHLPQPDVADPVTALAQTRRFWRTWASSCTYRGRWEPEVRRSLLLLKALTFADTGGIVAAATTSLPEEIGGVRNWDYRYCWLRDATFTLQAFLANGYSDEARAWRDWLVRAVAGDPAGLQIMYGLDGTRRIPEQTLDWLPGYRDSRPVRIGNAAADQHQLDVWGETLDGLYLGRQADLDMTDAAWDMQLALLDWLADHWVDPDNGLWEMRGPRRHFVHSKAMAWVGFERAIRTVEEGHLSGDIDRWRKTADEIHAEVCARGFDPERNTFTQFYGSRGLDASLLLLPRVGFLPWDDPRIVGTVDAVSRELDRDGYLLRYDPTADGGPDGLPGDEGAFLACSFWLVDALHGIGEQERAERLFRRLLDLRNEVGMLAEEVDPATGHHLGNTPQAFSLVGLVNSARHLGEHRRSDSRDACG